MRIVLLTLALMATAACQTDTSAPPTTPAPTSQTSTSTTTSTTTTSSTTTSTTTPMTTTTTSASDAIANARQLLNAANGDPCNTWKAISAASSAATPTTSQEVQAAAAFLRDYYQALGSAVAAEFPNESATLAAAGDQLYAQAEAQNFAAQGSDFSATNNQDFVLAYQKVSQTLTTRCAQPQ